MSALHRDTDGLLPFFAWPGGYAIVYLTDDGALLCAGCANGENGSQASEDADPGSGWRMVAGDILWEGPDETCAHCGSGMETEYGDPDEEGGAS